MRRCWRLCNPESSPEPSASLRSALLASSYRNRSNESIENYRKQLTPQGKLKEQVQSDSRWCSVKSQHNCDRRAIQLCVPEMPATIKQLWVLALVCLIAASSGAAEDVQSVSRLGRQVGEAELPGAAGGTTEAAVSNSTAASVPAESSTRPAKAKIPPINFTRVDELFDAIYDEREVELKWRHMDKQITDGVRAILKMVFPHAVAMSTDAKVSGSCSGAILKWILNLRNLRSWAVKMLDATGKPAAGILEGSLTLFGNYHECLSVRAPDEDEIELVDEFREYFRGQYCVLQMKPYLPAKKPFYSLNSTIDNLMRNSYKYYEKNVYDDLAELAMAFNFVNIRADLCVPSLCSRDDIQRVADYCKYHSTR